MTSPQFTLEAKGLTKYYGERVCALDNVSLLDKTNEDMVMELLKQRHQDDYTIIMVTHDPDIARAADRIIRFDHGRVVAQTHNHTALRQAQDTAPANRA